MENGRILGMRIDVFPNVSRRLVDKSNAREGLGGFKISRSIVVAKSLVSEVVIERWCSGEVVIN